MGEEHRGVRLPQELQGAPPHILEEYVRARLIQFAVPFARRLNPQAGHQVIQQYAAETLASLPPPEFGRAVVENRDLQLVFRHDCLSLGCLDPQCVLCEHNPHRRCNVNFAPKYLVNDILKAKCEAPIRVEIIDRTTGVPLGEDIPDVHLEMCILDGNAYDAKCLEAGQERDDDLDACSLLINNKSQPLLQPGGAATHNGASKVVVQLARGMAQLPELHVSDSSEAILSGRKPPFRLLVRAVHSDGRKIGIRHAVSEGFVVATRRTRTAGKVEIPNVDDHVSKLEHMGKETVKKLQDIKGSAHQSGLDVSVPDNCVNKVGEFRKLALLAEADGHLRQKLQQVLKLSKEKWDDARDHAMRAVVADNRMRIWYADKTNMELGLLFTCRLGNVDLDRPVGLLQKKSQDGTQTTMEATLMAQQTPGQREQVRQLQPQAVASWWQPGHPGWAIYPVDSEQFMSTGALDSVMNLQHESIAAPGASPTPANASLPALAALQQTHFGYGNGVLPPGLAAPGPLPAGLATLAAAGRRAASGGQAGPKASPFAGQPPGRPSPPSPNLGPPSTSAGPANSSPFAGGKAMAGFDSLPSMNLSNLGSMFSGPLASTDLSKLTGPGINLSTFPSIPAHGLPSGDLEQMLQHGADTMLSSPSGQLADAHTYRMSMNRIGSIGMGKLESMELPDAVAAAAMLHDMPAEQRAAVAAASGQAPPQLPQIPASAPPQASQPPAAAPVNKHSGTASDGAVAQGNGQGNGSNAGDLQRSNSGLESMQSIEHALGNVEQQHTHDIMDKVAEDWMSQQGGPQPKRKR